MVIFNGAFGIKFRICGIGWLLAIQMYLCDEQITSNFLSLLFVFVPYPEVPAILDLALTLGLLEIGKCLKKKVNTAKARKSGLGLNFVLNLLTGLKTCYIHHRNSYDSLSRVLNFKGVSSLYWSAGHGSLFNLLFSAHSFRKSTISIKNNRAIFVRPFLLRGAF